MTKPAAGRRRKCPICGAVAAVQDPALRPFCSDRCKLTDLGRWVSGGYVIPGEDMTPEQSEEEDQDEM